MLLYSHYESEQIVFQGHSFLKFERISSSSSVCLLANVQKVWTGSEYSSNSETHLTISRWLTSTRAGEDHSAT
jgi:hypothetical protein